MSTFTAILFKKDDVPHIERVSLSNNHLPYKPADWTYKTPIWAKAFDNMYLWLYANTK